MAKIIIVTGSVGAGKTRISKELAKKLSYKYLDVNKVISKNKSVVAGYDKKRKTKEIDVDKLNKILIKTIKESKKGLVIDSHLSHYLPKKYVDLCVVCKCSLKELNKRLKKRKYSELKIKENLEVEAFDMLHVESIEAGHKIKILITHKDVKKQINSLLSKIIRRKTTPRSQSQSKRSK